MADELRDAFVEAFGEEQAQAIENAGYEHRWMVPGADGADPFADAISIAIGFECITRYRADHMITVPLDELTAWIRKNVDFTGDVLLDMPALVAGTYDAFTDVELEAPDPLAALSTVFDQVMQITGGQ